MRTARRTFVGAFHHGTNRGYEGRPIFQAGADKEVFLALLERIQALTRVRILAYCVMDSHYHLVLQNTSGRMPDFFKQLNGRYAAHYRKTHGGRGYVFQDRYHTMLIQEDAYLLSVIAYVLRNPLKAGLASSFAEYPWSSGALYFTGGESSAVDCAYVEGVVGSAGELARIVRGLEWDELPIVRSALGPVIGDREYVAKASVAADRRSGRESVERRRQRDMYFEPLEKVCVEFERMHRVRIDEIDVHSYGGKRLRGELLVELKERAGLTYRQIARLDPFADLESNSLGQIYRQSLSRRRSASPPRG